MKTKIMVLSVVLLLAMLMAGNTMAWFTSTPDPVVNEFELGTVKVQVIEPGFKDISNAKVQTYNKKVYIKSLGSKDTYIRVRLIPQWSNPSLPVSNVKLNFAKNFQNNWVDNRKEDGYFYFKHLLSEGQTTSPLLKSITFKELGDEYAGETFTLKVVAEAVQATHEAWKYVWGLEELPFTPGQRWNQ